ncbi:MULTISPECIES: hypothetical protein [Streptomyces]|uniref:Uncharacterized protein n=1 Tax=Streptomyces solicathayae TaxID=3081768 RepID=A0ABZ0LSB7_9ACTN|nr:hypothetical protein [Streptomyces sp. HUAS YS2]WOX22267.1 hypothetical protein R2D22_13045 [Streptomyces sp. HUAS YS2]
MSLQDELNAVRRTLDELNRKVEELEKRAPGGGSASPPPDKSGLVSIPDTPYDDALWTDSDDEGLGARDRHAP